jgi:cytochrome c biogenesis protein CcdA/thiol-disulfide isomerase/thioredoxin
MLLVLVAYLGGVLTIVSPCILPVLPFVFARANRSFWRSSVPMLAGMAVTFAGVASLAAVGGGWAVQANQAGRWAAMILLAFFGLTLLFPTLADRAMQPLVRLGGRLSERAEGEQRDSIGASLLLGVATGLLWAPCAGPILGLILTGAALNGASASTTLLLLAYALGAATSLALALLIGGRVFKAMKRSLGAGQWVRRGLGLFVLLGVGAIALGLDTTTLARLSTAQTDAIERTIARGIGQDMPGGTSEVREEGGQLVLPVEGQMPPLDGITEWLNSQGYTRESLRGRVVLIDFWTYSCINCLRAIPYVRAWHERYARDGLVVIGVHAPEFAFERDVANVRRATSDLGITYPVAIDNDFRVWRAFNNRYWPAHYFIDAEGRVRHHHFGEGNYDVSERVIRQLLAEAGRRPAGMAAPAVTQGVGAQAAAGGPRSPETYVGFARAEHFVSPGGQVRDRPSTYLAGRMALNDWSLVGDWIVREQHAEALARGGRIAFRFVGRDLHLVMGSLNGMRVRYRIRIDGQPPGADAGMDANAAGEGAVTGERLYQLVRQQGAVRERLFEIEFLDPGVRAFAFTFG